VSDVRMRMCVRMDENEGKDTNMNDYEDNDADEDYEDNEGTVEYEDLNEGDVVYPLQCKITEDYRITENILEVAYLFCGRRSTGYIEVDTRTGRYGAITLH